MIQAPSEFRGVFRTDTNALAVYSEAAGIGQIIPRAIAVPADIDDVICLVRWAALHRIPLIPRGSGSSMAGGAIGDGIIVDLSRFDVIGDVDHSKRTVKCEPGALRNHVDAKAREAGFSFPVDPSSGAFCTVGGMASTNAAGSHTLRYGSMRTWVESLDCVFSDGSRATVQRGAPVPDVEPIHRFLAAFDLMKQAELHAPSRHPGVRKESSGYALADYSETADLVDLLVGSEGTLAIIIGLELRLAPLHKCTASLLGAFSLLEHAVLAAAVARNGGASACELIDRTFLDVARRGGVAVPGPVEVEAVLLAEVEGDSENDCETQVRALERGFRDAGAVEVSLALDVDTELAMWELRHAASPVLSKLDPSLKSMQFIEDGCVPPEHLGDYVTGVRAGLADHDIRGVIFGHAGDAHVHVNPLIDVRLADWRERATALLSDVSALVARLGGTLSGEHGDGRLRAPLLHLVWSAETLERFRSIKLAFDPDGIFNPGAKVALPGQEAIMDVKYDLALPPLPPSARSALARVEAERSYAMFRLDLLEE